MTNKPKIKGTKWETDNVRFLQRWWPKCKRLQLEGAADIGDISHPEGWAIEAKDKPYAGNLPSMLREAEAEAANRGVSRFVVLCKNRRSKGESGQVQDGYAVTRTRVWAETAHRLEQAEEFADYVRAVVYRYRLTGNDRDRIGGETAVTLIGEAALNYEDALEGVRDGQATD